MRFRADWRPSAVWMTLAPFMILQGVHRFHKDGWHSRYAWIQVVSWSLVFIVWSMKLAEFWQFKSDRLVMKRLLLPDVTISYTNISAASYTDISAIPWISRRNMVITLGVAPVFRRLNKRYIMVRDTPGFLSEMEHHVPTDVLHI